MPDRELALPRVTDRHLRAARRRTAPLKALRDPKLVGGGGFIVLLAAVAVLAPLLAPHNPLDQDLMAVTLPPFGFPDADPAHLLGTDDLGRDVLSRLIFGTRVALTVAAAAASAALSWAPCSGSSRDISAGGPTSSSHASSRSGWPFLRCFCPS